MELFATYFLIFIVVLIITFYFLNYKKDIISVQSTLDKQYYLVRKLPDRVQAANRLSYIRQSLAKVVNIIKTSEPTVLYNKYVKGDSKLENNMNYDLFLKSYKQLIKKYKNKASIFSESTPDAEYTSYSVNKGEELVFCLRLKKEGDRLVPKNTILFVALHELSHLMTLTLGHGQDFWDNFRFILKVAIEHNIYKSVDFNTNPVAYCGIKITDAPYV